jgi:hypothetical protein
MLLLLDSLVAGLVFTIAGAPTEGAAEDKQTVRTFHIGNSLTDTLDGWLAPAAESAGRSVDFHRFTIPGAPTDWLWDHPGSGFGDGRYPEAFAALAPIDHLFTQPFAGHGRSIENELDYSGRFYEACQKHSPNVQFWFYQQWPDRKWSESWSKGTFSLGGKDIESWRSRIKLNPEETVTDGGWMGIVLKEPSEAKTWDEAVANHTRFFEMLRDQMQKKHPDSTINVVPGGPALLALKKEIAAGRVPGMADFFAETFADDIHLNPKARYLIALVHYACIYRESPEGKVSALNTGLSQEQAAVFQRIAWETVRDSPWTGVSGQQPTDAAEKTMGPKSGEPKAVKVAIEKAAPAQAPAQPAVNHPKLVIVKAGHVVPEKGWFEFAPGRDLSTPALLDMRALLNEPQAGSRGRVIAKGGDLVFEETGEQARFWGVVADSWLWPQPKESLDYLSRRLAKAGVNLVRLHIPRGDSQPDRFLDTIHYMVHALKEQGIYVYLNWYCTACNIEYSGLFYFDPTEQQRHKAWARSVLEPMNPYTGISLAHDPAVVAVELLDEDSIFWFTFNAGSAWLKPKLPMLEKQFGDWLAKEYGALDKAVATWGPGKYPEGDDLGSGSVAMYPPYLLGGADWARDQRNEKRAQDQARFMTGLMRDFYGGMKVWLRDELGYTGLVVGSNWKTADERTLGPLDQYANLAVDITARNTYFEAPGVGGPFGVAAGDVFIDRSALREPHDVAMLMNLQCADHPHMMTEGGWTLPNRFRAEEPFLVAAYYSLQGIDGYCPFRITYDWLTRPDKWPIMTPATLGQYPAASIIYRRGYIKQGPIAINEALLLKDAYALKGGAISQPLGLDALQAARVGGGQRAETDSLAAMDPLAYFVGPVVRTIAENAGKSLVHPGLPKLIDREAKVVRSATGELMLDYGRGIATMDAPCAQGAAGFLGASGQIALSDITVSLKNEYGAVMVVSLDGKRLKESAKILVQVMTEEKFTGWKTEPARAELEKGKGEVGVQRIIATGGAPILVRQIEGSVILKWPDVATRTVTRDSSTTGYPAGTCSSATHRRTWRCKSIPPVACTTRLIRWRSSRSIPAAPGRFT